MAGNQWGGSGFYQQQPQLAVSNHYGGYGQQLMNNVFELNAWQAMQFQTEDEFQRVFHQFVQPNIGGIQGEQLCQILNTNPRIRNYYRINWSLELCKIMIAMLDRSKDGVMQYAEFRELLQCLVYWYQTFCQYDVDKNGFIDASELFNIINNKFKYRLSAQAMQTILKRYSNVAPDTAQYRIAFDDFVSLSVRLRAYTEAFRNRDRMMHGGTETGSTTFGYDDFHSVCDVLVKIWKVQN